MLQSVNGMEFPISARLANLLAAMAIGGEDLLQHAGTGSKISALTGRARRRPRSGGAGGATGDMTPNRGAGGEGQVPVVRSRGAVSSAPTECRWQSGHKSPPIPGRPLFAAIDHRIAGPAGLLDRLDQGLRAPTSGPIGKRASTVAE